MDHEQALRRDYFIQKHPAAIVISRHFTHSVHCAAILLFLCGLKQSSICRAEHVELISRFQAAALFYVVNGLVLNEATGQTKGHLP